MTCKSHPSQIASANANLDTLHETEHRNHLHYRLGKFLSLTFHSMQMRFRYIDTEKFISSICNSENLVLQCVCVCVVDTASSSYPRHNSMHAFVIAVVNNFDIVVFSHALY